MAQITEGPLLEKALVGETVWEGWADGEVIYQKVCIGETSNGISGTKSRCNKGLLVSPARTCIHCQGTGYQIRIERG